MTYTVDELIANPPHLHGFRPSGEAERWGLAPESLRMLDCLLEQGSNTLETGAGVSTVLFALRGASHICISPAPQEHERIRSFCEQEAIPLDQVQFIAELSEVALPRLDLPKLDLVLVDGSHSFPHVFIDWHYATESLRVGGHVLVDDTNLWTGQVLRDFLDSEPGWELASEVAMRTAAFRKVKDTGPAWNWLAQPYVVERSALTRPSRALAMLKARQFRALTQKLRKRLSRGVRAADNEAGS